MTDVFRLKTQRYEVQLCLVRVLCAVTAVTGYQIERAVCHLDTLQRAAGGKWQDVFVAQG